MPKILEKSTSIHLDSLAERDFRRVNEWIK